MDESIFIIIAITLLVITLIVAIILITVFSVLSVRKKQKEFVLQTSTRIKELDLINQKYKKQFGCLTKCDIEAPISFKYKRTFDHFCESDVKQQKFVLDYYEPAVKRTILILRNIAANALYKREIKRIRSTDLESMNFKHLLTYSKYVEIENNLFISKLFNAPESFSLFIIARYSSEKGYSNYEYKIECKMEWLQGLFQNYKHVDMYMAAHRSIMGEVARNSSKQTNTDELSTSTFERTITGEKTPYIDLLGKSYKEIIDYLLKKYGSVPGDYYLTETCKSKNSKISRSKEGLFIHHIDEDKAILLSTDKFAAKNPFEYQKANRLVYCDILEHLILHVKIAEEPRNAKANENELPGIGGAVNFICAQINDCYSDYVFKQERMIIIRKMIKNKFDDYIYILRYLYRIILTHPEYRSLIKKEELCYGLAAGKVQRVYNAFVRSA